MIVQCPNCQARFRLPDDKVGSGGAKLRCGKCRHVFALPSPEPAGADGLTDFDFPDDMAAPPQAPEAPRAKTPEAPRVKTKDGDIPPELFHAESYDTPFEEPAGDDKPVRPGFSLDDVGDLPPSGDKPSRSRRQRLLVLGGSLVFVLIVTLVASYFLGLWPGRKADKPAAEPPAATAPGPEAAKPEAGKPAAPAASAETPPAAAKPEDAAKVKDIMLQNVRQYYVSNEKAGQLFVIEGKAVNNFKTPKEMIKLEATLFDEKGGALATQEILAGNTVSLFQLQVMTRDELKNALSSQVGVLTNNTNLATGGEAPFMVVFFDPPEAVKEFGVKVVDAKDPPRQ